MNKSLGALIIPIVLLIGCGQNVEKKGFQVSEISKNEEGEKIVGLPIDSLELETRPRNVLLTKNPNHRLVPIYKVNYDQKGRPFTGSTSFYSNRSRLQPGNNWNYNFMPGFEAVHGYNLVNVSHFDNSTNTQNEFFERPVLIKTLYYPAFTLDTLNYSPVSRDFYMVSVYDEDTNKDGYINVKDLRRFYLFNIDGILVKALVPKMYSVMSSEYDPGNDFMYVFAKNDENDNGQMEQEESTHIFWIDLKDPVKSGIHYINQ